MIARYVDDTRALARLAQKLLHDVVVMLRPVPAGLQLPAVDDVADEVDRVGVMVAEEVEQAIGLAAARAEMNVGNKERTEGNWTALRGHESSSRVCLIWLSGMSFPLQHDDIDAERSLSDR